METFSQRLAKAIELSGYSRPEFAARAGVGTSALAKWLSGKLMPKSEQLHNLAKVGAVSMEWLLTGEGRRDPAQVVWKDGFVLLLILSNGLSVDSEEPSNTKPQTLAGPQTKEIRWSFDFLPPTDPLSVSRDEQIRFYEAYNAADDDTKMKMLDLSELMVKHITHRGLTALGQRMKQQIYGADQTNSGGLT